jgi:hypothetical protein
MKRSFLRKSPARTKIGTALIYFDLHVFVICVKLIVVTYCSFWSCNSLAGMFKWLDQAARRSKSTKASVIRLDCL